MLTLLPGANSNPLLMISALTALVQGVLARVSAEHVIGSTASLPCMQGVEDLS